MKGKVVIGISEISIRSHLIPIIREYNKTHPRVTLRVILYSSNAQNIDALMDGKVDLSITSDIIELPDKLKYTELIESRICAVAGASFSYLKNKKLSLKEVTKYPLILVSENTSLRHILKDYFDKNGIELNPRVEIASFDQINTLIGHNVGIGFIPEGFMVDYLVNNDYIFELDVNLPKTTTCLVERKDTLMSSYTKELKEMLKKYAEYNINVDY